MSKRPYFRYTTEQLIAEVNLQKKSERNLRFLMNEIGYRKRAKLKLLTTLTKAEKFLNDLKHPQDAASHEEEYSLKEYKRMTVDNSYLSSVLEQARTNLLDTSRRNRLLNFKEKVNDVPIVDEMPDQVYEHLVLNGGSFKFDPYVEPDHPDDEESEIFTEQVPEEPSRILPKSQLSSAGLDSRYQDDCLQTPFPVRDLERKLRKLYYEHRSIIEETGANNLYLIIGFLEWTEEREDSVPSRSPLILVSVSLEKSGAAGDVPYKLQFDEQALDTNYSLHEKLKSNFEINLPLIEEEQLPEEYWERVAASVSSRKNEGWNVVREITLGLFRFSKQVMWHDLDPKRWPAHSPLIDKKVLKRILVGPKDGDTNPGQYTEEYDQDGAETESKLADLPLILNADSSQYSALIDSLSLKDGLVIEGPPGTGKSQTISNLIAIALSNGLSILFVAEKMAALNVVFNRLEDAGLGEFCLQLHGLKTNKKELLGSLKTRLELRVKSPKEINLREKELLSTKRELIEFSKVMSEKVGPDEIPLYELPWNIEKSKHKLPEGYQGVQIENLETMTFESFRKANNLLDDLGAEWDSIPIEARENWFGFVPQNYEESQSDEIIELLGEGVSACDRLNDWLDNNKAAEHVASLYHLEQLFELSELRADEALPDIPHGIKLEFVHKVINANLIKDFSDVLQQLEDYLSISKQVYEVFDYASVESDRYAELLVKHSKLICDVCCKPEVKLADLSNERALIEEVISTLNSFEEISRPITNLSDRILRNIDDYKTLINLCDDLSKGPAELSFHSHEFHLKLTANEYLDLALAQRNKLIDRATSISYFNLTSEIETAQVQTSYQAIVQEQESLFPVLSKEYRKGKRYIRRLMKNPSKFSRKDGFPNEIKKLLDFCIDRDEFTHNSDYKLTLGTLFNGIDTDWSLLERLINFSQKLRNDVGRENAVGIISDWDSHLEVMSSTRDRLNSSFSILSKYLDSHPFPKALWQRPNSEISRILLPWSEKLSDATEDLIQPWCNTSITLADSIKVAELYEQAKAKEKLIENHKEFDVLLKDYWDKSLTNIELLQKQNIWFKGRMKIRCMTPELLKFIIPDPDKFKRQLFEDLVDESKKFSSTVNKQIQVLENLGIVDSVSWTGGKNSTLNEFIFKQREAISTIKYLPLVVKWLRLDAQVAEIGLEDISNSVVSGKISGGQASIAFKYSYYSSLLDEKISSSSLLKNFSETKLESLRHRFAKCDDDILKLNSQRIASQLCASNIPEGNGAGPVSTFSEKRLILQEIRKKARHIPIRQLVRRSSNAIQALKPCFFMSPLSVSQYLAPGDIEFDLVIMDEASQIRPEDALSSIARANACVIVGDPKQLPPTNFFESTTTDDGHEETIVDDTESILDVCLKQFPYRRLRWHYRSQHESLIQFSNEKFYDDDLIVFPSPRGDARGFGVHYTYVDCPSYKNSKNRAEAELVVENIIHHYQSHGDRTLGIATFNKRQAEEIQLILDKRKQADPVIEELIAEHGDTESLFIKNLENVQGDERDVIFISTTYGPEKANGPVHQRFGPINSDLGWRRLNVIATRARQRVEVFSSLRPTEIRIGEGSSRGVRTLRDYLEYASTGKIKEHGERTNKEPDSDFEIAVMKIIEDLGFSCEPQVGVAGFFIDIGVAHPDRPGEYLLGIECDGATYHSARSIRDRDRLRQEILEDKGWQIHRIWSTSWFQSRNIEIDKLERVLKAKLKKERIVVNKTLDSVNIREVLEQAEHSTNEEIKLEEEVLTGSLESALDRFWEKNIYPYFDNRSKSILSEEMIKLLVRTRPMNEEDWFNSIPMQLRQNMDPQEKEYLEDIIEVIMEY